MKIKLRIRSSSIFLAFVFIGSIGFTLWYLLPLEVLDGSQETAESQAGAPATFTNAGPSAALAPSDLISEDRAGNGLPWREPDFNGQSAALGWKPGVFDTPEGLRKRVAFWIDIFSKYSTDQGVLHDSVYPEIVYESVDFDQLNNNSLFGASERAKERERLVDLKRDQITERLKRLAKLTSPQGLSGEDWRVWHLFDGLQIPHKFDDASEKGRVRFQLGQKDRFMIGIYNSGLYLHDMEQIFREEGLPIELTRLPFVESSFNLNARSKVGASGIWQFMPRTAKPYMKVSSEIDERNDPLVATRASARLLKLNFGMLGSWPLALTGYNHGPTGVKNIVAKVGTSDLAVIISKYSSRTFGFASENFYACFLAALDVEENAPHYFGDVKWAQEINSAELRLPRTLPWSELLVFFNGNEAQASLFNPHVTARVRGGHTQIPRGAFIRVPHSRALLADEFVHGKITLAKLRGALEVIPMTEAPKKSENDSPFRDAIDRSYRPGMSTPVNNEK